MDRHALRDMNPRQFMQELANMKGQFFLEGDDIRHSSLVYQPHNINACPVISVAMKHGLVGLNNSSVSFYGCKIMYSYTRFRKLLMDAADQPAYYLSPPLARFRQRLLTMLGLKEPANDNQPK